VGVHQVHSGSDARVVDLLLPVEQDGGRLVFKVARGRPGQSAPPAQRARLEYATLARLGTVADPACRAPRPLLLDEEQGAVLMERCEGERLDHLLRAARTTRDPRRLAGLMDALRMTGYWLRRFHDQTATDQDSAPVVAALLEGMQAHLARVDARLLSPAEARAAGRAAAALAHDIGPRGSSVVEQHGDFWPGNVFIGQEGPQVIDFEGCARGMRAADLAWFLAHLELSFAYPGMRAFLAGYGEPGVQDEPAFRLCCAAAGVSLLARGTAVTSGPRLTRFIRVGLLRGLIPLT
jgi:aminoglycoside phosphotransferase (APT) family kinase protein